MKNNQIIAALTGVFILCSLVTFYNVWQYRASLHTLDNARATVEQINLIGPALQALLADTSDYSKKNPAVVPILQALTNNMSHGTAALPKPATK